MSIESSQIVWPVNFVCTLVTENRILANSYTMNISILPIDAAPGGISTGYKKIRHFVDLYLFNSIFIAKENPLLEPLTNSGNNIVVFPTEPYDLFVGHVLYSKFLAISEKYFHIDMINIDSIVGDNICYNIADTDSCGIDLDGDHWWNMDSTFTGHGITESWGDLADTDSPRFEPKIIKGGKKSES
jgi:hypothetical protein